MTTYPFTQKQRESTNHHHYPDWFKEAAERYLKLRGASEADLRYPTSRLHTDFNRVIDHECSVVIDGVECFATLPYNEVYPVALHMAAALGIELFTPRHTRGHLNGTGAYVHLYRPWAPWNREQAHAEGWDLRTCDKGFTMIVALQPRPSWETPFVDPPAFSCRRAAEEFVFNLANAGSAYHQEASARITPSYLDPRPMEIQLEEIGQQQRAKRY